MKKYLIFGGGGLLLGCLVLTGILANKKIFPLKKKDILSKPTTLFTPTQQPTLSIAPSHTPPPTQAEEKKMSLKVYFGNSRLNPDQDCRKVYPVEREVKATGAVAKAALNELFSGPTEAEKAQGYGSFFSLETKGILKSVVIKEKTAYVNLTDIRGLIPNASSSCGSAQFLAQIESTLKQFSTIKKVILAIEGQPEIFYEWLQLGCSEENNFCDSSFFK